MSTSPFRAAFWALGLSLAITLVLFVPNPRTLRLALHARRHPVQLPYEQTLVSQMTAPESNEPDSVSTAESETSHQNNDGEDRDAGPVLTSPADAIRVASADQSASLGLHPLPTKTDSSADDAPRSSRPVPVDMAESALDIPVPDPMPLPPTRTDRQPSQVALGRAGELPPAFPGDDSTTPTQHRSLDRTGGSQIQISRGRQPDRWTVKIHNAPVKDVLQALSELQGYSVEVDDRLQGTYSAEFVDIDPAQAFAIVVKAFRCSVKRRGTILMLAPRSHEAEVR